ncbi:MAG: hypothetical protein P4M13_00115 [Alphaproteobacteria bacterium]|nr:hypothetical protein [Alphaproteobacteria bacterium]
MIDWRKHRVWIGLLSLALVIEAGKAPVLGMAQQKAAQKLAALRAENDKTAAALRQFQDDLATAEKMKTEIDASETEKFLAPVDRLRVAEILEHRAAEARLSHFIYSFAPEQKTLIVTVDAGKQELATSKVTLAADAPTDTDVWVFLDAVRRTLPGRFALREFSLQRMGDANAPVAAANVHVTAKGDWLSNGASRNLAEETK